MGCFPNIEASHFVCQFHQLVFLFIVIEYLLGCQNELQLPVISLNIA